MDEEKLRQFIAEEIDKVIKDSQAPEIHLHIHADGNKALDLWEQVAKMRSWILTAKVLERLIKSE